MNLDELTAAINSLEIKRTRRELQSIMRFYDEDNTGVLDFEEFRCLMIELLSKNSQKELDFEKMKEEFVQNAINVLNEVPDGLNSDDVYEINDDGSRKVFEEV